MARRCSHCNHDSHNSRTCPNRGVRLFGVRLTDGSMLKSASTGNLAVFARSAAAAAAGSPPVDPQDPPIADDRGSGYVSEGFNGGASASRERKKGVPWTEHEHKMFLLGLKKLGKGDWRGIARNFVISRTPTQVASHAQKYFIRHSATNRRKRRVSLFDIVADETNLADNLSSSSLEQEAQSTSLLAAVPQVSDEQADMKRDYNTTEMETSLSAPPATMKYSYPPPVYPVFFPLPVPLASDDHADINDIIAAEVEGAIPETPVTMQCSYPPAYPSFFSPGFHCPIPCWTGYAEPATVFQSHEIVKPMAVHSKSPINVDELFGMSRLSLGACNGEAGPMLPRPKLVRSSESQSAFHHAGESSGSPRLDSSSSPIHAI